MSEEKKGCCCGAKTTQRAEEQKKKLVNRLKRLEGQIRGIQAMVEQDAYCNRLLPVGHGGDGGPGPGSAHLHPQAPV